eukprot:TRINITY_DN78198_c0_g1_i1.p1 TRINITY_DN78198_c0_g1~~TRINITY_DN78198_c0_g1_i1.p1  ORF type:complete len:263 (-),score=29.32 TRINITY_DN78198_c0_g1_i1:90-878(-)
MFNSVIVLLTGVVSSAPLLEDGLPRGVWFDNETFLKEQLAHNEKLFNESSTSNYYSRCNLGGVFKMPMCFQICDEWCWAATSSMVIQAYTGGNQCQGFECRLPSREFGRTCCPYTNSCHNSPQDRQTACNSPGTTANVVDSVTFFSGVAHRSVGVLSQAQLDNTLNSKHPVIFFVRWNGGGGHALLIGGCSNGKYHVHDPWGWYRQGRTSWQALTYTQLLQYVAPNGGVGRWSATMTASQLSFGNDKTQVVSVSESSEDVIV